MWHNEYEYKARPKINEVPIIDNTENYNRLMRIVDKRNGTWIDPSHLTIAKLSAYDSGEYIKDPYSYFGIDLESIKHSKELDQKNAQWQEFFNEYKSWARQQNIGSPHALAYIINCGFSLGNFDSCQYVSGVNVFNNFSTSNGSHGIQIKYRNTLLIRMDRIFAKCDGGYDVLLDATLYLDRNSSYRIEGVRGLNWGSLNIKQDPSYLLDILEPIFRTHHNFDED